MDRTDWDAALYEASHSFVADYGGDLVDLLDPQPGERVLDLGCGTGHLAREIADRGAEVVGLDDSAEMLAEARREYPDVAFVEADATRYRADEPFDAVFSNAVLHWVRDADAAIATVRDALRPGGRFVAELGGHGNVGTIREVLYEVLADAGYAPAERDPWYFPRLGEYASRLEAGGLETRYARLFDRPTALDGEDGLRDWLDMFAGSFFEPVPDDERAALTDRIERRLRPALYEDGRWVADYRRLRVVAVTEGPA